MAKSKKRIRKPKTIGYLRVSTADQDTQKNKHEIFELANEKLIKEAAEHLRKASHFLRMAEVGNKPYRVGKAINMMGKTTYDDHMVLKLFLGEINFDDVDFEMITHAVKLLKAELNENPSLLRSSASEATPK